MIKNDVNTYYVLAAVFSASFLTPFMISGLNIALPNIGHDLDMNAVLLSWVATSYLLSAAVSLLPMGRFADLYGKKQIFLTGLLVFSVSSALLAISPTAEFLLALRVFQGFGGSMMFSTGIPIVMLYIPPKERGKALGITVTGVYLGLTLGPFIGGYLTASYGWRSVFLFNAPLGLLTFLFAYFKLPYEPKIKSKGFKDVRAFDVKGTFIYAVSLAILMLGLSRVTDIVGSLLVIGGTIGLYLFIKFEMNVSNPILDVRLFCKNKVFALSNLSALISYSSTFAVSFLFSLYLQYAKGFDPKTAGLILISQPVMQAALSPFAGKASDKIAPHIIATSGMIFTLIGLGLSTSFTQDTSLWFIILTLGILGISFGLFSSPNTNAVMSAVDKNSYGSASGILGTMRLTGQMVSMGIVTVVFAIYLGDKKIPDSEISTFIDSFTTVFTISSVLAFIGVFASLARKKSISK